MKERGLDEDLVNEIIKASPYCSPIPDLDEEGKPFLSWKWINWKKEDTGVSEQEAINIGGKMLAQKLSGYYGDQVDWQITPFHGIVRIEVLRVGYEPPMYDLKNPTIVSDAWIEWLRLQWHHVLKRDLTHPATLEAFNQAVQEATRVSSRQRELLVFDRLMTEPLVRRFAAGIVDGDFMKVKETIEPAIDLLRKAIAAADNAKE